MYAVNHEVAIEKKAQKQKVSKARFKKALAITAKKHSDLANDNPQAFIQMLNDAESEIYVDLAEELGIEVEVAIETLQKMEAEVEEESHSKKLKSFEYCCPFCDQTNSDSCYYFSNSEMKSPNNFEFSMAWLMQWSLQSSDFEKSN